MFPVRASLLKQCVLTDHNCLFYCVLTDIYQGEIANFPTFLFCGITVAANVANIALATCLPLPAWLPSKTK